MTLDKLVEVYEESLSRASDDYRNMTGMLATDLYGRLCEHFDMPADPAQLRANQPWLLWALGRLIERYRNEDPGLRIVGVLGPVREQ